MVVKGQNSKKRRQSTIEDEEQMDTVGELAGPTNPGNNNMLYQSIYVDLPDDRTLQD